MYTEFDYLNANDLYNIQSKTTMVIGLFKKVTGIVIDYELQEWKINSLLYVDSIAKIESTIDYIGNFFNYPIGWIETRIWNLDKRENISYKDLNRLINNIQVLEKLIERYEFNYINEIYLGEELSL